MNKFFKEIILSSLSCAMLLLSACSTSVSVKTKIPSQEDSLIEIETSFHPKAPTETTQIKTESTSEVKSNEATDKKLDKKDNKVSKTETGKSYKITIYKIYAANISNYNADSNGNNPSEITLEQLTQTLKNHLGKLIAEYTVIENSKNVFEKIITENENKKALIRQKNNFSESPFSNIDTPDFSISTNLRKSNTNKNKMIINLEILENEISSFAIIDKNYYPILTEQIMKTSVEAKLNVPTYFFEKQEIYPITTTIPILGETPILRNFFQTQGISERTTKYYILCQEIK